MVSTYNYIDIHINILVFTDVSEFVFIYVHSHLHLVSMGWLRLVGSLKLQVSFAKEPYKRGNILQKRPIILRSLQIIVTPYLFIDAGGMG